MEWSKLDIRKASVLKKQVDLALLTLKQAIVDGDETRAKALLNSFTARAEAIEEFRAEHDADERSILFERERLRLRKSIQENVQLANLEANRLAQQQQQLLQQQQQQLRNGNGSDSEDEAHEGNLTKGSHRSSSPTGKKGKNSKANSSPQQLPRGAAWNTKLIAPDPANYHNKHASPTRKIYDWEHDEKDKGRDVLILDELTFVAAEENGVYIREQNIISTAQGLATDADEVHADTLFVLNSDEINILASRLNRRRQSDHTVFKSQTAVGALQHSTPFVDSQRISQSLLRPDQKQKWITKQNIRPNAKI